jgi:hypothetical protein
MTRLLQQLFAPLDPHTAREAARTAEAMSDEEMALGWESANPALQFEAWEPTPLGHGQQGAC